MAKKNSNGAALVIVESPAKARTIARYLGDDFVVESSIGHIRDLPSTAAEIPPKYKGEAWARLGVDVENDFEPLYIVPSDKKSQVKKLRDLLKSAAVLYLATDEDREGEAIAWHLAEVLQPKVPVRRMVFDEITKAAIQNAVDHTREINARLVDAQETRRILDRLFGYEVSPVLWRKVKPKLSAGRVQSVATRLVVERERARMAFVSAEYWDLAGKLNPERKPAATVDVKLVELGGKRLAVGKDFVDTTGQLKPNADVRRLDGATSEALVTALRDATFSVAEVNEKPFTNRPYAPFITSTLQQEAGRKLRFSAQRAMRLAQQLYENGYITYMRTDSTTLSREAINAARTQVRELYGENYLPAEPRSYTKKSKNAQEAHEAIRPAGEAFRTPKQLAGALEPDQLKLYDLIWKRTVASQMKDAHGRRTQIRIAADTPSDGQAIFTASGKVIDFAGFWRAYVEGSDDPSAELEDQEKVLPELAVGDTLTAAELEALQHFTQPPARYTEASLIRELEERGIGRPSTYASIIQTIQDRGYVFHKGPALVPTFTAFAVTQLLERYLPSLVDYDFTAKMEDGLDTIANGNQDSTPWLRAFYFGRENGDANGAVTADGQLARAGLKELVEGSGDAIDPREVAKVVVGHDENGEELVVRVGRYGPYVQAGDSDRRCSLPEDLSPDEVTPAKVKELLEQAAQGDQVLGHDPETGKPIYLKSGRFGPYVQLGDAEVGDQGKVKRGGKPKMASLWPGMTMESLTLEDAQVLLSFPRELGPHHETGEVITAQDGRFGPYLKAGKETRSLPNHEALRTVTHAEAIELFKQPKRGRNATSSAAIKELGEHPQTKLPLSVKNGRFGPYVTDGEVNATVPKDKDPASVTLDEAVELIAKREQKMRDQGKDPRGKAKKKATTKKSSAIAKKKSSKKKGTKKKSSRSTG